MAAVMVMVVVVAIVHIPHGEAKTRRCVCVYVHDEGITWGKWVGGDRGGLMGQ